MQTTLISTAIPEALNTTLSEYLALHPDWDMDRAIAAALSLFLLQNGNCPNQTAISQIYLNAQFGPARNN